MAPSLTWIDPRTLAGEEKADLWRFVSRFEDLSWDDFEARLRHLTTALVGRHASGAIGGIAAASIFTVRCEGEDRTVVWGEWGFLDPDLRGRMMLERAMVQAIVRARLRHPRRPVYFMAEAATWKGYLALARGHLHFWPRPGHPLPEAERRMVAQVVDQLGDPEWDPARGVFHRGKAVRTEGGETVPEAARALVEHYRRLNPGQADGDSLLCMAAVTWGSLVLMPLRTLAAQAAGRRARRRRELAKAA